MKVEDFISAEVVVALPTKSNPKVYLAIGSSKIAKLSFKLYNPFSLKGKLFKWVAQNLCIYANKIAILLMHTIKKQPSDFVKYLENELGVKLTSSVYIATAKDKVVLQLIRDNEIYGYLKFPLTPIGKLRLQNEKKAIEIFSEKNVVSKLIYSGSYKTMPFIILENINGAINELINEEYVLVLKSFYKVNSFKLKDHPRVLSLSKQLLEENLVGLHQKLSSLIENSVTTYREVYEHGDFAPWNIIQTNTGLVPFDFEYFEEIGLEYLDELKYHVQIENLLKAKTGLELIDSISAKVNISEFQIMFQIFLIKEILTKTKGNESIGLEESLLQLLATRAV